MSALVNSLEVTQEQERIWNSWKCSDHELEEFGALFKQVDEDKDGFITGEQARLLFTSSGVSMEVLGKIWSLADRTKDKKLDSKEYAVAMYLIRKKQRGEVLPSTLPENLLYSVFPELAPPDYVQSLPPPPDSDIRTSSSSQTGTASHSSAESQPSVDSNSAYKTIPQVLDETGIKSSYRKNLSETPTGTTSNHSNNYGQMPTPLRDAQLVQNDNHNHSPPKSQYAVPILAVEAPPTPPPEYKNSKNNSPPKSSPMMNSVRKSSHGESNGQWMEVTDEQGKNYYFNRKENISQWERPNDFEGHSRPRDPAKEPVPPPPVESTEQLMENPEMAEFFKKFLESQEATAEFGFYVTVENFRHAINGPIKLPDLIRAENIYNKYIERSSPFAINIPSSIVKELDKKFKAGKDKQDINISIDVFDEAKNAIAQNLEKEQFPKFMKSMFYITMYNSMMNRKAYELPDQLWKEFLIASEGGVEDGWGYVTEKKGILVHKKKYENSDMTCVRGSGVVPLPVEEMYTFATSIKLREHWDNLFSNGRIVERLDERTVITQYEYRSPRWAPMFSGRDFVMIRTEKRYEDGTILVLSRSVIHKDCPEREGFVRSEIDVSGFVLRPCGTNSTIVIYVSQSLIKGVPKWAEARLLNKRALLPNAIRKFVEKELKDKKKIPAWKKENLW